MLPGLLLILAAGTAVRLSVPDLVERSDLCVEARVTAARAILEPGRRIDTEYTLSVDRTFWGEPEASRAIRLPGGVLPDGRGMLVPGLPGLAVGDDVILFLSKTDPSGARMPIGLAQGRMLVTTDLRGRKRLVRDQAGLELANPRSGAAVPADERTVLEYAATVAEIEAAAASRRARVRAEKGGK
jgi:hypothetical protein